MNSYVHQVRQLAERNLCLPASLHDYQWEGVAYLYKSESALLADEMGLGKTIQTIIALALLIREQDSGINRALIVAPASLVPNWIEELKTWAPLITARRVEGGTSAREVFYLLPIPVLVCSYEQIRIDGLDRIPSRTFDLVILDEAQRIKNRNSTTALACQLLPRRRSWALSATPLENSESDTVSILNFIGPLVEQDSSTKKLSDRLTSIMLRRRKFDVRSELPPVIFQDMKIELSEHQREKYDELWINRAKAVSEQATAGDFNTILLGLLTKLKMICNYDEKENTSSKLDVLSKIFEGIGESGRILIFSQFVKTLQWLSHRIRLPHELIIGSMLIDERQSAIDRFKNGTTPRALLISFRAGGVGLNLGEATHVVLFDRWWNPATEIQAIYRAHRFEREEPLHVIRFLTLGTIEERVAEILRQKEELFDEVVESSRTSTFHSTKEELMQILELTATDISPNLNTTTQEGFHYGEDSKIRKCPTR